MNKAKMMLLSLGAVMALSVSGVEPRHIAIWDNSTAPTDNGLRGDETEEKPGNQSWLNVQKAEMWVYGADAGKATGQAIVFFPGGGYKAESVGNGHTTCKWLASHGITAAVVKYRLPNGHPEVPLNDADEAVRIMRTLAAEYGFSPDKVGVSGTSAGAHLAGVCGIVGSERPNFMVLFYPVVSADADKCHKGSFERLFGVKEAKTPVAQAYSIEKHVDQNTPPAIIFHCDDDNIVPAVNSALLYAQMKLYGIEASLHIYPSGGHGFGMSKGFKYHDQWQQSVLDWLDAINR